MSKSVAILGTGGWGTALGMVLCDKGITVKMWSLFEKEVNHLNEIRENPLLKGVKIPNEIIFTNDLDCAVNDADIIVLAVPSHVVKSVCNMLKKYNDLPIIVNVSKGFDEENCDLLSDVIKNTLSTDKIVVLSGPTHAEEVAKKIPTTIVAASENTEYAEYIQNVFACEYFRVYTNKDVTGVEICGAVKNVIALCAGISDGCGFGDNTKAALMTRGMKEIQRLGVKLGGLPETFMGLTGVGDLIVTCTSMHSRNRRAGILIGKGKTTEEAIAEVNMVVEGIKACDCVYKLAEKYDVDMPIVNTAYDVLHNGVKPEDAVKKLMLRDMKSEQI